MVNAHRLYKTGFYLVLCIQAIIWMFIYRQNPPTISDIEATHTSMTKTQKRPPDAIIIGVEKCGTSALKFFLSANPDILPAKEEETSFFVNHYHRGIDWYLSLMPEAQSNQIIIEKTPGYFTSALTPSRARELRSDLKFILVVCNPVKRLISKYVHMRNIVPSVAKTRNLTLIPEKNLTFEQMYFHRENKSMFVTRDVKYGRYSFYYKNWLNEFPRKQIFLVDGDNLLLDPVKELNPLEKFLGFDPPMLNYSQFEFHKKKRFFCIKNNSTLEKRCLGDNKGRRHPDIPASLMRTAINFYKPYNQEFDILTGKIHSHWYHMPPKGRKFNEVRPRDINSQYEQVDS